MSEETQTPKELPVIGGPATIVRAIEEAEIVRMKDPDDLNDDGEVIGKAEPMTDEERMAALDAASREWVRTGNTLIVPPTPEGREYMKRMSVEAITTDMRAVMFDEAIPITAGWSKDAKDDLGKRIMRERIENLSEWLRLDGGWNKLASEQSRIAQALEDCYAGQPAELVRCTTTKAVEEVEKNHQKVSIVIHDYVVRLAGEKASPTIHKHVAEALEHSHGRASEYVQALQRVFEAEAWELLLRTDEGTKDSKEWMGIVVRPLVQEMAKDVLGDHERRERAKPISKVRTTAVKDRAFLRLPKIAAGVSWAFGGPGVTMESVRLDGRDYTPAPDIAIAPNDGNAHAIVPAGISLLPSEYLSKPHQAVLPLDETGQETAPPLAVAIAGATQYAITLPAAKLAVLIMGASMNRRFDPTTATLRELAQRINPGARLVKSHFETITKSLAQLDNLRVMLPNGLSYRVLDTPVPWRELTTDEYDQPLVLGFARSFAEAVMQNIEMTAGRSYRGDFLLDETGVMGLKRPGLMRQYVRSAAFWNAYWRGKGEPDPSKMPVMPTEHWAALTNHLSPAAAEYAHTKNRKRGGHVLMSNAVKEIIEGAAELEAEGLVKVDKADKKQIRLLPPDIYIEAWRMARAGEDRKGG